MNAKQGINEAMGEFIDRIVNMKNEIEKAENSQMKEQ